MYVLQNTEGRFYIGQTDDLRRRLAQHNDPDRQRSKYTAKGGRWSLVWQEEHPTRAAAMRRERFIKSRKSARWIRRYLLNH